MNFQKFANSNSRMQPKILLTDDHSMIRRGLKLILQTLGYTDVEEASSCGELMKELRKTSYTHLVLDINLTDGSTLELMPALRKLYPDVRIMIFSMQPASIYGEVMKQYDIHHYGSKNNREDDTIRILKQFFADEPPARKDNRKKTFQNPFSDLTPRELQILHYLLKGRRTKEIAQSLNLQSNTVSTMKARLLEKTKSANLVELVELAALHDVN